MARQRTGGTPATTALDRAGVPYELRPYDHDPGVGSYGLEAAAALGVEADRVFKTLVVRLDDGRMAVAVVPVAGQLDLKALARVLGCPRAAMADTADAERATGYVVGGISPIGQKRALPIVVDATALHHRTVLVSAGRRGLDLELAPADLVTLTRAVVARVGRSGS